jgi:hypothetical protein
MSIAGLCVPPVICELVHIPCLFLSSACSSCSIVTCLSCRVVTIWILLWLVSLFFHVLQVIGGGSLLDSRHKEGIELLLVVLLNACQVRPHPCCDCNQGGSCWQQDCYLWYRLAWMCMILDHSMCGSSIHYFWYQERHVLYLKTVRHQFSSMVAGFVQLPGFAMHFKYAHCQLTGWLMLNLCMAVRFPVLSHVLMLGVWARPSLCRSERRTTSVASAANQCFSSFCQAPYAWQKHKLFFLKHSFLARGRSSNLHKVQICMPNCGGLWKMPSQIHFDHMRAP